jgi:outer membrane protein assembly factor BamB
MAYAGGRLFVPSVERCMRESAVHTPPPADASTGNGVVTAIAAKTGRKLWVTPLGSPAMGCATVARDVVFAPTLDGHVFGLAASTGRVLWRTQTSAGIIGCPAVSGNLLLVGAGAGAPASRELVAYGLPKGGS